MASPTPYGSAPHIHQQSDRRASFAVAMGLTLAILVVETIAGMLAHSLALLADAAHITTDVFALGLGWFAATQATRRPDAHNTWGYHRVGILTALANAITLVLLTGGLAFAAITRLSRPEPVNTPIMILAALVAIVVNIVIVRFLGASQPHLHGPSAHHHDLNTRAALLHVLGDIGASIGVVLGAIIIVLTGWQRVDPLISLVIAAILLAGALRIGRDAISVLLEATPREIDVAVLSHDLEQINGVLGVHHIHVWEIADHLRVLSSHVVIEDMPPSRSAPLLACINTKLRDSYGIAHSTIQFEERVVCQHDARCVCCNGQKCSCSADPADELLTVPSGR